MKFSKKSLACILSTCFITSTFISVPFVQAETVQLFNNEFETSTDAWSTLGAAKISSVSGIGYGGTHSLLVTNRTAAWNGPTCTKTDDLKAGSTYNLSAYVMYQTGGDTEDFNFQLKYTDSSAKDHYVNIATATVTKGVWTKVENNAFSIPVDATNAIIYFETPVNLIDFYIDSVSATGDSSSGVDVTSVIPLKDVFAKYFKIGCAATPTEMSSLVSKNLVKQHFNSITLGNEMKPDSVLDKAACQASGNNVNPQVSLNSARYVLQFCVDNNISVRGHVLCWHSQTPAWFFKEGFTDTGATVSKEIMSQRLENYIKNIMQAIKTEFPTLDIYAWDVVNEAFQNDTGVIRTGGFDAASGQSAWTLVYGDDSYIDEAFTFARKYAPANTKLFYNDYNEYISAKRDAIYNTALRLKGKGIIDGIGMQSHLDINYPDVTLYKAALTKYASLGLEIQVTELDLTQKDQSATGIQAQTTKYTSIMKAIIDSKKSGANITAVVFWGITDATSWRKTGYPLLFDANYSAKPVLYSIESLIDKSEYGSSSSLGDLNKDGAINDLDLLAVKSGILNGFVDSDSQKLADVNLDGKSNILDYIMVKRYILKIISHF